MVIENLTEVEDTLFRVEQSRVNTRTMPIFDKLTKLQITFEVNTDLTVTEREVYTTFMLLGDVGGLSGILATLGSMITSFFTYLKADNHMVSNLYAASPST